MAVGTDKEKALISAAVSHLSAYEIVELGVGLASEGLFKAASERGPSHATKLARSASDVLGSLSPNLFAEVLEEAQRTEHLRAPLPSKEA